MKKINLLVSIILVLLLSACGNNADSGNNSGEKNSDPKNGGTIVIGLEADPNDFNPNAKGDDQGYKIHQNIFNRLLKVTNKQEIIPDLAKSYSISEDGTKVDFELQEGVKWHDGKDFSADDVKFTFDTIISEKGQAYSSLSAIKDITVNSPTEVTFNLSRPDSSLIESLSWYGIFIMPKHIYEGTDWTQNPTNNKPVGTGPFKFVEHKKGVSITLEKNEDYWGDIPYLDKVVYSIIPDGNTAIQALNNQQLDILGISPPFAEFEGFKKNENLSYGELIWPSRFQIAFNLEDEHFSKQEVRDAVALGLDRDEIIAKALKGIGAAAYTGMVPAYTDMVNNDDLFPKRNIEKAKELLEKSGYTKDKNGNYFSVEFDIFNMEPFNDIGIVLKENLKEVGIEVKVNLMEFAAWDEKVWTNKKYNFALLAGYQGPGPGALSNRFTSEGSMNIYNYSNIELDQLLMDASVEMDDSKKSPLYKKAQSILVSDKPMIPISEWMMVEPFQNYVEGHPMSEEAIDKTGFAEMTYVWINK